MCYGLGEDIWLLPIGPKLEMSTKTKTDNNQVLTDSGQLLLGYHLIS